jgi:hypothetical protein
MKQQIPIRRFEYFNAEHVIAGGAMAAPGSGTPAAPASGTSRAPATGTPANPDSATPDLDFRLMTMDIDFEKRTLSLEGISKPGTGHQGSRQTGRGQGRGQRKSRQAGSGHRKSRHAQSGPDGEFIKVFATICPGPGFQLSETADDGLFLSLDGVLEDSKTISSCNGLLMLHCRAEKQGWNGVEWYLVIYLCDDYNEWREIRLNLPMWPVSENAVLN